MVKPIFVTGIPRSGTSLTTGILSACGAFTGETYGPSEWNRKGSFENRSVKDEMVKPWLLMVGADPLGLDAFPNKSRVSHSVLPPETWRKMVTHRMEAQGWDGEAPWCFKDCKLVFQWGQWRAAFPDAVWIHVHREPSAIVKSCLRAEPMIRRKGTDWQVWARWVGLYRNYLDMTPCHYVIKPQTDILESQYGIERLVQNLGLTWRPDVVEKFIDMDLWGG